MSIKSINGESIYNFFISGAQKLIYSEKALNSINVFPVADGDTGTNLALTMKMIVENSKKDRNIHKTLVSISNVAIENAYGNSGMIFAQYLNGFAVGSRMKEQINLSEFADIAKIASDYAYESVASPKEGTILSVMRDWAVHLKEKAQLIDFESVIDNSVNHARDLVEQTKRKLKVLMDNNVVDAGAKGFLIFLEGILEYVKKGKVSDTYQVDNVDFRQHRNIFKDTQVTKNRYCSQFYLSTEKTIGGIKEQLSDMGDSLVVTGRENRVQVHIHTDRPDQVMQVLVDGNTVLSQKIEDMKIASDIIHRPKSKIGLITDSIADISQDLIDEHQISVIPVNLICDSVAYLDKLTMKPDVFYEKLDTYEMNPTSAQPSYNTIERTLLRLSDQYESLIGVFVSKKMSGTFSNAKKAANRLAAQGKKISVVDSKVNSVAQGLLVLEAARLIESGYAHEAIIEKLEQTIAEARIMVSLEDLSQMIRGGRIPRLTGMILSRIKLQPVISIDANGNGIVLKKTLKQKRAIESILAIVKNDMKEAGIKDYAVVYSDKIEDTYEFQKRLEEVIGKPPAYIAPISPVVGLNAGKGAFAVGYIKEV